MRARFTSSGKFWMASFLILPLVLPMAAASAGELDDVSRSGSTWKFSSVERCFMERLNNRRAAAGKSRLYWDKQMGYVARRHAQRIASARTVAHDYDMKDEITRWYRLGQNTGGGRGCKGLTRSFWNSDSHRANILGRWKFVAVGAAWSGGRVYVQQIFESRRNPGNVYSYP